MLQRKLLWDVIIVVTELALDVVQAHVQDVEVFAKLGVKVHAVVGVIEVVVVPVTIHVPAVVLEEASINPLSIFFPLNLKMCGCI